MDTTKTSSSHLLLWLYLQRWRAAPPASLVTLSPHQKNYIPKRSERLNYTACGASAIHDLYIYLLESMTTNDTSPPHIHKRTKVRSGPS
uniref:Uncharacterized protein n=1 Tax=Kalanchoe fedtschenkoi TaxID=63787 RepID=A0A7N0UTE3_KALFE